MTPIRRFLASTIALSSLALVGAMSIAPAAEAGTASTHHQSSVNKQTHLGGRVLMRDVLCC